MSNKNKISSEELQEFFHYGNYGLVNIFNQALKHDVEDGWFTPEQAEEIKKALNSK